MSSPAHILLVGNEGRLLNERAVLLANFWTIAAISSFDEAGDALHTASLVVLCHTLTEAQRVAWVERARAAALARPILSLEFTDPADVGRRNGTDATVEHRLGPAALVSAIYELLTERGIASRQWTSGGHTLLGADGQPPAGP
jgi:hypothetical protein